MKERDTATILHEVRKMLCDLMETESNDKFMRIRLLFSLKMIDSMIAARETQKRISNRIKSIRNQNSR